METKKKYSDERRIHTMDEVREDNEKCDWLMKQKISYMVACKAFPGAVLFPDNEVSRYRPIEDALNISFHSFLMAETYLDEVREKAWQFNIYLGVNAEGEPPVEKWTTVLGSELIVMVMWQVAEGRKKYNNFRLGLFEEKERPLLVPRRKEKPQEIVWRE